MTELLEARSPAALAGLVLDHSAYSAAAAPLLVCPRADTPLSCLIAGVGRPVDGFWFPADGPTFVVDGDVALDVQRVTGMLPGPGLGGDMRHEPGLLVGKLRRRGWIEQVRGGKNLETFDVTVRCSRDQLAYCEVEIELEERIGVEVSDVRRLRLSEVVLPETKPTDSIVVQLPTLGPQVTRRVRLWDADGTLLDQTGEFQLIEGISLRVGLVGHTESSTSTLGGLPQPSFPQRLRRAREVGVQYEKLLEEAMDGRVVSDGATARRRITESLAVARGELLVLDPYFGRDQADWALLTSATVPTRVLTSVVKPGSVQMLPQHVAARSWAGSPPFHDRVYVWDGGGLSVGTSPNGFGKRVFRMDRVPSAESTRWRDVFEIWWSDSRAVAV